MERCLARDLEGVRAMRSGVGGRSLAAFVIVLLLLLPSVVQPIGGEAKPRSRGHTGERIIGGSVASPGQFPFVVALMVSGQKTDPVKRQFCGGSIIAERYVLTAAHCVGVAPRQRLQVLAGRVNLRGEGGQVRRVAAIYRNPNYIDARVGYDVAVLELDRPFAFNEAVGAASLVTEGDESLQQPGSFPAVAGWGSLVRQIPGKKARRPHYPSAMRWTTVPVTTRDRCQSANWLTPRDAAVVFCAGSGAHDSCQGDSGGPLFAHHDGEWVQIGIVDAGLGCAAPKFPGMYARLSAPVINQWVRQIAKL
ncbi:MAG: serine protease [Thermomicrobiales bacterium]|nr:serine protease [Thermomicrobiales bacterium]